MKRLPFSDLVQKQLGERLADELRRLIRLRRLPDPLPGENTLAARFAVSRPVLREALQRLVAEGLIIKGQGRRSRVVQESAAYGQARRLRILALLPRDLSPRMMSDVRERLEKRGWIWLEVETPRAPKRLSERALDQSWATNEADCLLLLGSSRSTQQWAADRQHPTVIIGSTFPEVELPSVDVDYHALGWHAGGRILQAGYRQVVIPTRFPMLAGDEAVERGLREFLDQQGVGRLMALPMGTMDLALQLDRFAKKIRERRTAFFTLRAEDSLTVLTWLLHRGYRVPEEVGLLSRESLSILEVTCPVVTRYESDQGKLIRSVIQMINGVSFGRRVQPMRVMPRFIRGGTL